MDRHLMLNPDGSQDYHRFTDASRQVKGDTLQQDLPMGDCLERVRHTIQHVAAAELNCGDIAVAVTCSCGLVYGLVSTRNGGCGVDHRPQDLPAPDPWHRSQFLFDSVQPVEVDAELVLRHYSLLS